MSVSKNDAHRLLALHVCLAVGHKSTIKYNTKQRCMYPTLITGTNVCFEPPTKAMYLDGNSRVNTRYASAARWLW